MPDFLTRRNGAWHFVRRVPSEFAGIDPRGIVKHSTKIRISQDRSGRRASRVAERFNEQLERYWRDLAAGKSGNITSAYDAARSRARSLGYEYLEMEQLLEMAPERRVERFEALIAKGAENDPTAAAALLGGERRPIPRLSQVFHEYEAITKDEVKGYSPDQLRIWRTGRVRALDRFMALVGDKLVTDVTLDDGMDYVEWWRGRVVNDNVAAKTANKDIGQLSRMLKDLSIRRRITIPDIFRGLRLRGETEKSRIPYDNEFIQKRLLAEGALAELNEDARFVLYVIIETGLRPSEVVNLQPSAIKLDAKIPYVKVVGEGRRLKTEESEREIPLVGVALKAMKLRPHGFPRYRDKSSSLSATLNKFLLENDLRPSKDHTVYSLRHSFKDRLIASQATDELIDRLMGHKSYKPKYGLGPTLDHKLKFMELIAFEAPDRL